MQKDFINKIILFILGRVEDGDWRVEIGDYSEISNLYSPISYHHLHLIHRLRPGLKPVDFRVVGLEPVGLAADEDAGLAFDASCRLFEGSFAQQVVDDLAVADG
jgi:hypothetical protein